MLHSRIASQTNHHDHHAIKFQHVLRQLDQFVGLKANENPCPTRTALPIRFKRSPSLISIVKRFDTLQSSGFQSALTSGIVARIKSLHDPKFYLGMAALAALRWSSVIRNYYFWILVAFLYKWYRARYVYKVPVWDRQPNWNNVITSKEQEKDLKAFTCKTCGSTIFIAKSREFFFEGGTGIGGLGCFTCGAKGADNFVMDRDRIVEDVADMDDYFEYERPLDFVSREERKRLLKEAGGDEEKANDMILEREAAEKSKSSSATQQSNDAAGNATELPNSTDTTNPDNDESESLPVIEQNDEVSSSESSKAKDTTSAENDGEVAKPTISAKDDSSSSAPSTKKDKSPKSNNDDADLDALGMDDL
ncbi:hypothetical protein ACA910_012651 [Epithemia clementina (nom. ined.)]